MIKVENLSAGYERNKLIVKDVSFEVKKGEIFGFLGPSGAGKSTLQKVLIGMLTGYKGSAVVNGIECKKKNDSFYQEIGVDFEYSTMYEKLTLKENLNFFASLYKNEKRSIPELLESVGLQNDYDKLLGEFSKGMKARANFIKAIIHNPKLIFLDEPTSGLDPTNNKIMKELILKEKENGKTILITTHNMQDATELCDRVAFIVNGSIKALDSPHNLIMQRGAASVRYSWKDGNVEKSAECKLDKVSEDIQLQRLIRENKILSIHSSEPTLNDIFVDITGRSLV